MRAKRNMSPEYCPCPAAYVMRVILHVCRKHIVPFAQLSRAQNQTLATVILLLGVAGSGEGAGETWFRYDYRLSETQARVSQWQSSPSDMARRDRGLRDSGYAIRYMDWLAQVGFKSRLRSSGSSTGIHFCSRSRHVPHQPHLVQQTTAVNQVTQVGPEKWGHPTPVGPVNNEV